MTAVTPVSAPPPIEARETGAARAAPGLLDAQSPQTLDYEAFLQLLVAQMENQDPLDPISETEYVAQLANFSNVEQNIITNQRLAAMMTANAIGDAQSLIGRTLETPGGLSGTVAAVQITATGTQAILVGGEAVPLGEGVTIS